MADPYRTSVDGFADDPPTLFALAKFGGRLPDCPCCTAHASEPGRICNGRRSWWYGKPLCPEQPHFHPKCNGCGHVWLMATRSGNAE